MRTIVLIAAMVLASATAQAGESRSLTTGPDTAVSTTGQSAGQTSAANQEFKPAVDQHVYNDAPTTNATAPAEAPRVTDTTDTTTKIDAPRYTVRPPVAETTTSGPATTTDTPSNDTSRRSSYERRARAEYSAYTHGRWTAGRIISTLHRHGVYW